MKNVYALLITVQLLLCIKTNAQLNYTFSATAAAYQPVVGGTTPPLVNRPFGSNEFSFTYDEGFANAIPIGFTFNYNGKNYTVININANGFATLGDPLITDSAFIENYYTNNLTNGNAFGEAGGSGYPYKKSKPIIAPLWDDLDLQTNSNFRYLTTGSAGSHVFTIEWAKALWQYDAAPTTLSFELKLYEGTNVIEFCYKDEGGSPSAAASASIGITDGYNNGTLLSLQNSSANPTVSNTENADINTKPANNQVYRFTPSQYPAALSLSYSGYTNNKVNFKWQPVTGASGYQYAVTSSPVDPASGAATTLSNAGVTSLIANTGYYIHVRTAFAGNHFSNWLAIYFKSATNAAALPFNEGFETAVVPALPDSERSQVTDSLNYRPGEDYGGSTYEDPIAIYNDGFADDGVNYLQMNANLDTVPTYYYLPGISLAAGSTYKIRFKYQAGYYYPIGNDSGLNRLDALTLKSGMAVGADSATNTILNLPFRNVDLNNTDANYYLDTAVLFTAKATGVYYFSFEFTSGIQKDTIRHDELDFAYAALDDISVTASALPVTLISFSGEVNGKQNLLHWSTASEQNNTGFEVQRSNDGYNFNKIGFVNTKAANGNSDLKLNYDFSDIGFASTNYYRLKQIDRDGKFNYSNIVVLNDALADNTIEVYPNPVRNTLNIKIASTANNTIRLSVTDISGKTTLIKSTVISNGETIVQLDVSHLSSGTYFIKLIAADGSEKTVKKFVKE